MRDWRKWLGAALGLSAALVLVGASTPPTESPALGRLGPILSECDGAIQEVVIQYVPAAEESVAAVYRDFLAQLPAGVGVRVICPQPADYEKLCARVGPVACSLKPLFAGHEMTCWSRDRWLAFAPAGPGEPSTLYLPRGEAGEDRWPQRAGDRRLGFELSNAMEGVAARRSNLYFDGGDIMGDSETVFVAPAVLRRNLQHTVASREELEEELRRIFAGRRVVLLEEVPDHHLGMFMMVTGRRSVLVGDPALARRTLSLSGAEESSLCPCGDDFSAETQKRFDNAAAQCAAAGYRVSRLPVVPGRDGRAYITYLNVLLDRRDGRAIVYLPAYRRAEALNAAAEEAWRFAGWEARRVDATKVYPHGGVLHCLVNVLRRG
jgi:hypothetical protein